MSTEVTPESLRAERDKVVAQFDMVLVERDKAREDVGYWQQQFRLVCDESQDHKAQVAAVIDERDTARFIISEYQQICREARAERDRANAAVTKLISERDAEESRADAAHAEVARLRATHTEQIEDMKARWLKDARERSTDLFLAKNPLPSSEAARGRRSRED